MFKEVVYKLHFLCLRKFLYLPVFEEVVKEVVDDVCSEYPHTKIFGHFLSLPLHSNIKCQNDSPSCRGEERRGIMSG